MTQNHHGESGADLDNALHALPQAVEPAHDLWPRIEARLERPPGQGRVRVAERRAWPWQAAAVILLVAASSLITATWVGRGSGTPVAVAPAAAPAAGVYAVPAAFGPAHALSPEYETAHRQLSALLQQRIGQMPPSARQKLAANLAELRRAAAEINAALDQQPGDPLLEELLLNTYQEELAVLAAANQLTSASGLSTQADATRMQL